MEAKLVGYIDWYQSNRICGWAKDADSPRCVNVEVLCDGAPIAVVACNGHRADLLQYYETTDHGFTFDVPWSCRRDGLPHTITIRFCDTQEPLISLVGDVVTQPGEDVLLRELRAATYQRGLWQINEVALRDEWLCMKGWWLPPRLLPGVNPVFQVNGTPFETYSFSSQPNIARLMDFDDTEDRLGFDCRVPLRQISSADGVYRFGIHYDVFPNGNTGEQDLFFLTNDYPLPESARRQRIGDHSGEAFQIVGSTVYMQMEQALLRCFGKSYDDFPEILDWGCGCGRLIRHFAARSKSRITGIEIDPDNLQWCAEHYLSANFREGRLEPPLDIPDDSFDLIFGISVFTHLTEELQHQWLAELRRITKPGGVVLMTVTGDIAWFRQRYSLEQCQSWKTAGFIDVGSDTILDAQIGRTEYYRLVYHDTAYVLRQWKKHFHVVDLIPGGCSNHQDLVVMQK